jgi:hypothetical protein
MGRPRLELSALLRSICPNVYFQPPADVQMEYPAIVYQPDRADSKYADNNPYTITKKYSATLISTNPDEAIFEALAALPMCAHERFFVVNNLRHHEFSIYF